MRARRLDPYRLRYARLKEGITRKQAATRALVPDEVWKNWETGHTIVPSKKVPQLEALFPSLTTPEPSQEYRELLQAYEAARPHRPKLPEHLIFPEVLTRLGNAKSRVSPSAAEVLHARTLLGVDQWKAALMAGVTERDWWTWETGVKKVPPLQWEAVRKRFGALEATGAQPRVEQQLEPVAPKPIKTPDSPPAWVVKEARGDLTVAQAATLVQVQPETWERWEAAGGMPVGKWILFNAAEKTNIGENFMEKIRANLQGGSKAKVLADPAKVKMHREVADLTREAAGAVVGVTARTWQAWELGTRDMPQALLDKFAGILTGKLNPDGSMVQVPQAQAPAPYQPMPLPWKLPVLSAEMPDMPPLAYVPLTPEQERIMAECLDTPLVMSSAQVHAELQNFQEQQDNLRKASQSKHSETNKKIQEEP